MIVSHLSLRDFRNYAEAEVAFGRGVNVLVGRNGQGKTNLVESIVYLSSLGSHRVSGDRALIRSGADSAIVRARLENDGRELLAEVQINAGAANRAQVNRGAIKPRELPRYVKSVLFAPEDLAIVRGDPGGRRRYLDQLVVQLAPRFAGVLQDYDRTLRQRNTLLKSMRQTRSKDAGAATLDVWDDKLVAFGSEIIAARADLVARLARPVADAYGAIVGADHGPTLTGSSSVDGHDADDDDLAAPGERVARGSDREAVAAAFRAMLAERRSAELDRGVSLVGPHRDDVVLGLNCLPVKGYASHGESWSFALALRLGSAAVLRRDAGGGDPVLILDDVFAELDRGRRDRLAAAISGFEQVLITAAVEEDVPAALQRTPVFVRAGRIVEREAVGD